MPQTTNEERMWPREQGDLCGELDASKAGNAQTLVFLSGTVSRHWSPTWSQFCENPPASIYQFRKALRKGVASREHSLWVTQNPKGQAPPLSLKGVTQSQDSYLSSPHTTTLLFKTERKRSDMVAHIFNPSHQETEAGGSL